MASGMRRIVPHPAPKGSGLPPVRPLVLPFDLLPGRDFPGRRSFQQAPRQPQGDASVTRLIFAYLDPGSSSMIVQMFLGGLAAVGVALKLYWRRFLRFL